MDEPLGGPESLDHLPEPAPRKARRGPSLVWLLPMVVVLIGGWLSVKAYRETGPTITITFASADGMEAGQTKIKHKDVEIGKVTAIGLSRDRSQVVVTAELRRDAQDLLSDQTRFWVVRARIGTSGISGLGTLLSGAYIGMDPGPRDTAGSAPRTFTGLDSPSLESIHQPGALLELKAEKQGSLNVGSPVHYRQVRVGEVASIQLAKDAQSVTIKVFIEAPHHKLIHKDTRFWDAGAVDVSIDANGVRMRSDSLMDLLLGSIAFENPMSLEESGPVPPGHVFPLFKTHDQIYEKEVQDRRYFVVNFNESVRGLTRGAPVEFQGIRIGQVEDFRLEFNPETLDGKIPVLIALEPERLFGPRRKGKATPEVLDKLVKRGLRAQLRPSSLLTGSLFVNLAFHPEAPPAAITEFNGHAEIPTVPSAMGAMMENVNKFMERLQKLPLEELLTEVRVSVPVLRETLAQTKALLARLDQETLPQAKTTLVQAQNTLAQLENTLKADSPTQQDLRGALEEFAKASRALRDLAETLERHPEALVWGKGKTK